MADGWNIPGGGTMVQSKRKTETVFALVLLRSKGWAW